MQIAEVWIATEILELLGSPMPFSFINLYLTLCISTKQTQQNEVMKQKYTKNKTKIYSKMYENRLNLKILRQKFYIDINHLIKSFKMNQIFNY